MRILQRKVLKDITNRKLRSLFTILGIVIGIMSLTAISIAANQFQAAYTFATDTSARPDIEFTTSPAPPSLASQLGKNANVRFVQGQLRAFSSQWSINSENHNSITIEGFPDFQHLLLNKFELVQGHLPGPNQILLEYSDRSLAPIAVGDHITVRLNGTEQTLTVSGFATTKGQESAAITQIAVGYMRMQDLANLTKISGFNDFLIQLDNFEKRDETTQQLAQIFDQQKITVITTVVGHNDDVQKTANSLFGAMQILSATIIILSILLLISTVNTIMVEHLRIIGTMKALGAVRGTVMRHYLTLAFTYGFIGTVLGLLTGIVIGDVLLNYLGNLLNLTIGFPTLHPQQFLLSTAVGILTPILAATYPIYQGTRITVKEALSEYGTKGTPTDRAKSAKIARKTLNPLPQVVLMGLHGIFRRRARSILTIIALIAACVAFLAVQTAAHSFDAYVDQAFQTYHFDLVISVATPVPYSQLKATLNGLEGIQSIERLNLSNADTQWGPALLTGVDPQTQLYQKQVVAGRWFTDSDQNVALISQDAAKKSNLHVGDIIAFHDALHSAQWHIIGIVRDNNNQSNITFGVLVAPMKQINAFLHVPNDDARTIMLRSTYHTQENTYALVQTIDEKMNANGFQPIIETAAQEMQASKNQYQLLDTLLYVATLLIAATGTIGLFNTLTMSVIEQRREIGILRSMGARAVQIALVFWTEGIATSMCSWLIALVIGIPIAYAFVLLLSHLFIPLPFTFNGEDLLIMLGFILLVSILSSIGPALGATRIRIIQTLHYE